jgi:hypothetical protein
MKTETYEFYIPFAHIPGRYEWARIHTATHGTFDICIVIETTTDKPVTVYVNDKNGERFMADRYPESTTIIVDPADLTIESDLSFTYLLGRIRSDIGPIRTGEMRFTTPPGATPRAVPYGGEGFAVWGSRWSCTGVDMELDAVCSGFLSGEREETFERVPAIITRGSSGTIYPMNR